MPSTPEGHLILMQNFWPDVLWDHPRFFGHTVHSASNKEPSPRSCCNSQASIGLEMAGKTLPDVAQSHWIWSQRQRLRPLNIRTS